MSETYKQAPRLIHRGNKFQNQGRFFYQLPQSLMSNIFYELSGKHGNQIKLMCVLIGTAGDGSFRVSQRWIMEQTGMDESGYKRARKALADRGWITLDNGCIYVNFDAIWERQHDAFPDAEVSESDETPSGDDALASGLDEAPSGDDAGASYIPTGMSAPASDTGWGDEMPGPDNTPGRMKSNRDASCGTGDASDPSRGAVTTPIIYNNIEEYRGYNTKSLPPRAAVGWHEEGVSGREPERQKKMLSYDFLDDE